MLRRTSSLNYDFLQRSSAVSFIGTLSGKSLVNVFRGKGMQGWKVCSSEI